MKYKKLEISIFITIFIITANLLYCYNEVSYSAESFRLGNTQANESSVYNIFSNPSGLYNIQVPEIFITYNILYPNLTDDTKFINNTIGYATKFLNSNIGIGYNQFGIEDWYTQDKLVLSFSNLVKKTKNKKLILGLKISKEKEYYNLDEYMKQNPVFAKNNEKEYYNLSFGGLLIFNNNNCFGLTINNLNQPDTGFEKEEKIPVNLNFSYKYNRKFLKIYPSLKMEFNVKTEYILSVATEYSFLLFNNLKFSPSISISYGTRNYNNLVFGFLLDTPYLGLTYSFNFDFITKPEFGGQHIISLNYKFIPILDKEIIISKKEYDNIIKEKESLEKELNKLKTQISSQKDTEIQKEYEMLEKQLIEKIKKLEEKLEEKTNKLTTPPPSKQPTQISTKETTNKEIIKKQSEIIKKRYHKVEETDTLPKIAEKYYGNSSEWKKIYEANKDKIIRGQLIPGSLLEIP